MARTKPVPLLSQPVIVSLFCAEIDALTDSILADDGPHKSPLTEARAMLLRQIRAEIREAAPLEDETPSAVRASLHPDDVEQ